MEAEYLPVVVLFIMAAGFVSVMIILSALIGKRTKEPSKLDNYECGLPYVGEARLRFSVKYYIVAMLFTLFDIELIFFFPWAVYFKEGMNSAFIQMSVFIAILIVPYIYAWKKGVFEWK